MIGELDKKPAVMGHSTGGLLAQMIADRGLSAATVAIDPGPFRGVLPLPVSALRSAAPLLANPLNRGRAKTLTLDQFKYGWANALDDDEAKRLHDEFHVPAPGVALMQMANANVNPFTEAKLDPKNPNRGPLLIIDGEVDHTVPWAIANAAYKRQSKNEAPTEIKKIPNRGHSLTIDSGWREVAETALEFVKRFSEACPFPGSPFVPQGTIHQHEEEPHELHPVDPPRETRRRRTRPTPGHALSEDEQKAVATPTTRRSTRHPA